MAKIPVENEGIRLVVGAVHALDEAEKAVVTAEAGVTAAEATLAKAREAKAKAELRLQEAIAHGRCDDDCPPIVPASNGHSSANGTPPVAQVQPKWVLPPSTPICWRIAFRLVENPEMDYQATAEAIWGKGLDKNVAKNRVGAQLSRLKDLGVIKTLGGNRYEVNLVRLSQLSKINIYPSGD